jgi:hypothetical protein
LLEAAALCRAEGDAVLLISFDLPYPEPLRGARDPRPSRGRCHSGRSRAAQKQYGRRRCVAARTDTLFLVSADQ